MPNRILKESICTSENIDDLSWFEEVVFYRLIVNCDDYGRMDGRSKILKARLFPLKSVTDKQISDAVQSLRTAGIVDLYFVDGKPFLQLRTWDKHQQTRAKKSKGDARKAFAALKNVNLDLLLSALEEQKKSKDWLKDGGQFIPYPATWLRRCCWEDEQEVNTENAGNTDYGTIL